MSLNTSEAITEHSMCQPGRPEPQGDSQNGSPGLLAFHKAKSRSDLFSVGAFDFERSPSPVTISQIDDIRVMLKSCQNMLKKVGS